MLPLLLALALHAQIDVKVDWGLARCHDVADRVGYDDCVVQLSENRERMWIEYQCATWDEQRELWALVPAAIVEYRWTNERPRRQTDEPVTGCPEYY